MELKKLAQKENFINLKKGDELLVVWKERECWNNSMKGKKIYSIIENREKDNEIILQIKDNHYFNYNLFLKGESIAEEIFLIQNKNSPQEDGWYCEQCGKEMDNNEEGVYYQDVGYCSQECIDERRAEE